MRRRTAIKTLAGALVAGSGVFAFAGEAEWQADSILVLKRGRTLQLLVAGEVKQSYKVALGRNPVGAKERQGDGKTPEGKYTVDAKNAHSQFHRALHVSYPNAADRERARKLGVSPGGDIMIHGLPPKYAWVGAAHRATDWTEGCIAVTDAEIEEIWKHVAPGTPVEIRP